MSDVLEPLAHDHTTPTNNPGDEEAPIHPRLQHVEVDVIVIEGADVARVLADLIDAGAAESGTSDRRSFCQMPYSDAPPLVHRLQFEQDGDRLLVGLLDYAELPWGNRPMAGWLQVARLLHPGTTFDLWSYEYLDGEHIEWQWWNLTDRRGSINDDGDRPSTPTRVLRLLDEMLYNHRRFAREKSVSLNTMGQRPF